MLPITRFHGDDAFLSNFYLCVITLDDEDYTSVEHAFQAAKTFDPSERQAVRLAPTPGKAKQLGRKVALRPDWEEAKYDILEALVRQKFTRHAELRTMLLATGDAELIEGNTWNDRTYGMVWDAKKNIWIGKNFLGKTLMKIREEIHVTAL